MYRIATLLIIKNISRNEAVKSFQQRLREGCKRADRISTDNSRSWRAPFARSIIASERLTDVALCGARGVTTRRLASAIITSVTITRGVILFGRRWREDIVATTFAGTALSR